MPPLVVYNWLSIFFLHILKNIPWKHFFKKNCRESCWIPRDGYLGHSSKFSIACSLSGYKRVSTSSFSSQIFMNHIAVWPVWSSNPWELVLPYTMVTLTNLIAFTPLMTRWWRSDNFFLCHVNLAFQFLWLINFHFILWVELFFIAS